ncbi:MAG: hypothetical protein WC753_01925 [Candidatus Gracilibacteria bacterium]
MKLPLVLALTTASILAAEEPVESSEIGKTGGRVREVVSSIKKCDEGGTGALVTLGGILLGSAAASWADAEYKKRVPPEKRISARVLRMLAEKKDS